MKTYYYTNLDSETSNPETNTVINKVLLPDEYSERSCLGGGILGGKQNHNSQSSHLN
jgi:hypothetical protein